MSCTASQTPPQLELVLSRLVSYSFDRLYGTERETLETEDPIVPVTACLCATLLSPAGLH